MAAAALTACGDDARPAPPAVAPVIPRLAAVDAVLTALAEERAAVDDYDQDDAGPSSERETEAHRAVRETCGALDRSDPLLHALGRVCTLQPSYGVQSTAPPAEAARTVTALASAERQADRAIRAASLSERCRAALVTPQRQYAAAARRIEALRAFERAQRTRSRPDALATAEAETAADRVRIPDPRERLRRLRAGC